MLQVNLRDACGPCAVGLPEHLGCPHGAQVRWQEVTQPGCQHGCGQGRDSLEARKENKEEHDEHTNRNELRRQVKDKMQLPMRCQR